MILFVYHYLKTMGKRLTFIYALCGSFVVLISAWVFFVALYLDTAADRDRLKQNQSLLLHNGIVEIKQMANGNSYASTPAITLRSSEFTESGDTLVRVAKQIGIKSSRISEAATAATITHTDILTTVWHKRDTVTNSNLSYPDSLTCFSWHDDWVSLSGCVSDSLFHGYVSSIDTIDIIVHRVPRRFLFFRFGCKQVRMDIISRNPHTRLTYARYYQLVK